MSFEDRFQKTFDSASQGVPGAPLDWDETHARAKRGRRVYLASAAAATVLLVVVGTFAVRAMGDPEDPGPGPVAPAPSPSESTSPSPSPTDGPTPTPTPPGDEMVGFEEPFAAVQTFLDSTAHADPEAIWEILSPASKTIFGDDFDRFSTAMPELGEGWGSWASAEGLSMHWHQIGEQGDQTIGVVTLTGSRNPEGSPEPYAAAAVPIRITSEGEVQIEPFSVTEPFEFEAPSYEPTEHGAVLHPMAADAAFEVLVPDGVEVVNMVVAPVPDEPAVTLSGVGDVGPGGKGRRRATWFPDGELFGGEWFVAVLAVLDDGAMQASSVRFLVE